MPERNRRGFGRRLHGKVLASMVVLGLVGVVAGVGTWSAFSKTTDNTGNTFAAGSVTIGDNDANGAIFNMSGLTPGVTDNACIQVTYSGTLTSNVHIYGTTTGTGLDAYLTVKVTRGTVSSGAFDSCTNFTADATDYIGGGAGVIFNDTLANFPDDYNAGIVDAPGALEAWNTSEVHAYRFDVTVVDDPAAGGLTAGQAFTWEARNT